MKSILYGLLVIAYCTHFSTADTTESISEVKENIGETEVSPEPGKQYWWTTNEGWSKEKFGWTSENPYWKTDRPTDWPDWRTPTGCFCGEGDCYLDYYGRKICKCFPGFAEYDGFCKKCDCGMRGKCEFNYEGYKFCKCENNYIEVDGKCIAKEDNELSELRRGMEEMRKTFLLVLIGVVATFAVIFLVQTACLCIAIARRK